MARHSTGWTISPTACRDADPARRLGLGRGVDTGIRSERVDSLFAETATLSRYLEVEIALARTQAELDLIPERAAEAIVTHATVENIDLQRHRQSFSTVGFPIVGVVEQLTEIVPDGLGEYAHWGATTQDIMDTATILALRDVVGWVEESIDGIAVRLAELAERHRRTLMMGRSQLQHAVPITFGYKATGWLMPLLRHRGRRATVASAKRLRTERLR